MSDDLIQITVNGKTLDARKGQMLIEVTDQAGVDIPRFCYHKKLSVAANCRMCLVEVEKAPKPLPACATPVMPGMIVHTQSELAREAQKGTMEFLLINHPLDCPVCDQGGECELQDVAVSYGPSVSDYSEGKRVVMDTYIGPLISTEMTRCIHCTRCVRFGDEIAGVREFGATGRGEDIRIGTYIAKSVDSELSGNMIDVCPVGALTAKPSRFGARAWEITQHESISVHDSVGSNTYIHTEKGIVHRVVPRENEQVNEVWISDRDRFAYEGLNTSSRAQRPMLRVKGELKECTWEEALNAASIAITSAGSDISALVSAESTIEEMYLAQKLLRARGSNHIDHRLGQSDFRDQNDAPVMPWLGIEINELESLDAALLIGSNIRKEHPIAGLRLRKAALKGAKISLLNTQSVPLHFEASENLTVHPAALVSELAAIASAAKVALKGVTGIDEVEVTEQHKAIADSLQESDNACVFIGTSAVKSTQYSLLRLIATQISAKTGATLSYLPEGANTNGAWLSGCVPHRTTAGKEVTPRGKDASVILGGDSNCLLLVGVEPELDSANPKAAIESIKKSKKIVVIASNLSDAILDYADVVLPQSVYTESSGTYVNATGRWQSIRGVAQPTAESRPGWKILRVLGSMLDIDGFEYHSSAEVCSEVKGLCQNLELSNDYKSSKDIKFQNTNSVTDLTSVGVTSLYSTDTVVRRATALQKTKDARVFASIAPALAERLDLSDGDQIRVKQNGSVSEPLLLKVDSGVVDQCVQLPLSITQVSLLGLSEQTVELEKCKLL